MTKEYWCVVLKNFEGEDDVYYFSNCEIAIQNFLALVSKYLDYEEFSLDIEEQVCSWFDSNYNEDSTQVYVAVRPMPPVFDEIIF